jgi:hypothetical protein
LVLRVPRRRLRRFSRATLAASPQAGVTIGAARRRPGETMLLKFIAFIAAAIPIVLFVRSVFFRRPTRVSEGMKEFKKQVDLAVWIFLGLVGLLVTFAAGKLTWTWWAAM